MSNTTNTDHTYQYFLKGDISGIQDFIFNVKSEKAARVLKGRSFFVQIISEVCIELIKNSIKNGDIREFYNGGGNFYLFTNDVVYQNINLVRKKINAYFKQKELYLTLSIVKATKTDDGEIDFQDTWSKIHKESDKDKNQKFKNFDSVFNQYSSELIGTWPDFTRSLLKSQSNSIRLLSSPKETIDLDGAAIFTNYQYSFSDLDSPTSSFKKSIVNKLPQAQNLPQQYRKTISKGYGVLEFEELAELANFRTGTAKLGILKMDIDNLGLIFKNIDFSMAEKLSEKFKEFFDEKILEFLTKTKVHQNKEFDRDSDSQNLIHNIYVVFSGGDDCFMVGAWDAIFQMAGYFQKSFNQFTKSLFRDIPNLQSTLEEKAQIKEITISAGIVVVPPKFPVIRFAHLAEEALEKAKKQPNKNHINVFGESLSWKDFETSKEVAIMLSKLIKEKNLSRSFLERFKQSANEYQQLQVQASGGETPPPKVWRLFYALRDYRNKGRRHEGLERVIRDYSNGLIKAFMDKKFSNAMKYAVAARWAEFLTRNPKN